MRKLLGKEFAAGMAKQNVMLKRSGGDVANTVVAGERPIGAGIQEYYVYSRAKQGGPIMAVLPEYRRFGLGRSLQERRMAALLSYRSQYGDRDEASGLFPQEAEIRERLAAIARFYGNLIGVRYGEPFVAKETMRVDDIVSMGVRSF